MESKPSKTDIEAVFNRLRAVAANKVCFDCNAKNPTWSSVTYGVFICLDCSAVHRNLGVHLTFVRSTLLDTNWTWQQLRQMQLGGNSNAQIFFAQHNCITTDAPKKYNSRAAQLYRDKLSQAATNAVRNNTENNNAETIVSSIEKLHITSHIEEKIESTEKSEVDFFAEHENFVCPDENNVKVASFDTRTTNSQDGGPTEGPSVIGFGSDHTQQNQQSGELRKSTIGARKPAKKSGLGAKRGGLGATKVKTNFADLEREAELAEESRLRCQEEGIRAAALSEQELVEREAAMRLAYKDIGVQQAKMEQQLKQSDPRKAEQMERLGMGVGTRTGVSHSVLSDMQTIEQENSQPTASALTSLGKLRLGSDSDGFFDDYGFSSFSMNRNASTEASFFDKYPTSGSSGSIKDSFVIVDDPASTKSRPERKEPERTPTRTYEAGNSDLAQKKFGNAKGISSDAFFDDGKLDFETQANINRFQGSSSISSSDFFGTGNSVQPQQSSFHATDLEDVRESVRQGVTKVAGKLSSIANGVMSSLQEKYGY